MIPCLQPDSASERATKKKKKLQVVFHTPQGPFLADLLVFCEPVSCTVPEKHDAGIMRIGNCFNAYCIYLASKQASKQASRSYVTFLLRLACNKNRKSEVEWHGCSVV